MTELGVFGSATYATTLPSIDEMMNVLPDNTGNLISARDVRDVVLTLYDDIQTNQVVSFSYSNPDEITNPIGNWFKNNAAGWKGTFSNVTLQELFDGIFYKDSGPSAGLSFNPSIATTLDFKSQSTAEYDFNTGFDEIVGSFGLKWTATAKKYDLNPNGIIERTPVPTPTPDGKNGNPLFNIPVPDRGGTDTVGPTKVRINQSNSYVFKFEDEKGNQTSAQVGVNYGHRVYWGRFSGQSKPDGTYDTTRLLTSLEIRSLTSAGSANGGISSGSFLTLGFNGSLPAKLAFTGANAINGAGDYLVWAFPTSYGTPKFYVGGFFNTDFTKIQSSFKYKNIYGFEHSYDVWVSNVKYTSSADIELR